VLADLERSGEDAVPRREFGRRIDEDGCGRADRPRRSREGIHCRRAIEEKEDESPAQYQEIHGHIYDDYVDSSDSAID
jgi:hypothetical protein